MMNEILETLTFLKTLSACIWQTPVYSWQWFIKGDEAPQVPVAGCQYLQSGFVNLEYEPYAWLFFK